MLFALVRMAYLAGDLYQAWLRHRLIIAPITILVCTASLSPLVVLEAGLLDGRLVIRYALGHIVFACFVFALVIATFFALAHSARLSTGVVRSRARYLLFSLSVPIAGVTTTNLVIPLFLGQSYLGYYGPLIALSFLLTTAHAFIRHRFLDVTVVVRGGVTWTLAILAALLPPLLALWLFWPFFSSRLDRLELAALLGGSVLIGLLSVFVRDAAGRALDSYLYRRRTNYPKTLRQASRLLTRVLNLRTLLHFMARAIVDSTGAESVWIFLERTTSELWCVCEYPRTTGPRQSYRLSDRVLEALRDAKEPIFVQGSVEVIGATRDSEGDCEAPSGCQLVLPVISDEVVIAAIVLGAKRSGDPYFSNDIDLLSTLANQAGVAIKNAQLYGQVVLINEYLQNIVATIESGVVAVNQDGQITMFNRAAGLLTARASDDLIGRPLADLPAALADPLRATMTDGRQRVLADIELPRATKSALPIICCTSPLREPSGDLLGAVAVFSDVTPLKELETERRRAERLAYFEALAAGIAHEIKNPLVAIKTFVQLLPRRLHDEQFREQFGRIAGREIGRMEQLLERLRALAQLGRRPRQIVDLRSPIGDALDLLQPRLEEKRILLEWTPDPAAVLVLGDPDELEQLVLNLCQNAMEAMEPGGTLAVRVFRRGDHPTVEVEDSGPGIREDLIGRIFDPFVTTKLHGSGLGLAICSSIVDAHRASIRAANKSGGGGAVFTIEFPKEAPVQAPLNT
jgi:PAS domain S-box-containing protein